MTNDDRKKREIQFIKTAIVDAQRRSERARNAARQAARHAARGAEIGPEMTASKLRGKNESRIPRDDDELIVGADSIARVLGKDWNARRVRYYHGKGYLPTEKLGRHIVVWRSRLMSMAR